MEIDKELVRQLQKQSLEEYCLFRSIPIDEFASLKFEAYKLEKTKFSKHRNAISNIFLKYVNHPKSASLDAILDLDYEISEGFREDCLRVMMAFFSSNTYNTFLINIDFLRENAQELGIDTGSDDWLFRYLNAVPFIEIYSPLLEAYAQKIPYSFPKIIISNSLNNVFENGIVPLLVNHVFTIEKSDGALPRFHLLSNDMFPNDLASTGNMIISLAEYYLGLKSSSFVIEFQNIEKSEAFPIFGTPLALGIRLFTIFHEYSHVVYSHFSKKSEIKDEVFADNLALHIFIKRFFDELRSYKLESEAGIMSFFRIYSFAFLSPLVLMNFLTVLNILLNDQSSHTHPHPSIREKYLRKTLLNYFHNRPPLQMELEKVYSLINSVFEYIYAQFNLRDGFVEENDIESLKDINLPVQFLKPEKPETPLPWFQPTYVVIRPDEQLPSVEEAATVIQLFVENGDLTPLTPRARFTGMYYSHNWKATNEPRFLHAVTKTLHSTYPDLTDYISATDKSFSKHGDIKFNIVEGISNIGRYRVAELLSRQRFPTKLPLKKNVVCQACGQLYTFGFPQQLEQWRKQKSHMTEYEVKCNNPPCKEITIWVEPDWVEPLGY